MWRKAVQWAKGRREVKSGGYREERHIQNSLSRGELPREMQGVAKVKVRGKMKGTPGSLSKFIQ